MDFFALQDDARRRTGLLLVYYALAIAGIVAGIYLVLTGLLVYAGQEEGAAHAVDPGQWWQPELLLGVALVTLVVIGIGSLAKTLQLRQGGAIVARMLGGRLVAPDTTDADERRLLNIVEEMAIASGISVPDVYLLDGEPAINAFAAGFSPADAVVGVTSGTLTSLSRDELQGVIAHEFSHIVQGDMRLNIKLMGVLHGILMIALLGYVLLRSAVFAGSGRRSRNSKGNAGIVMVVLGLALIVIGYIGVFFANLIKSAISRQREFLADASAVQYTRNPDGIAGALKRIAGLPTGARIRDGHAAEASHLFFGNALRAPLFKLLATHPPLPERIRRLDPGFNPQIARIVAQGTGQAPQSAPTGALGFAADGPNLQAISAQTGNPGGEHLAQARQHIDALPASLMQAAHHPEDARALVFALLIQTDASIRAKQLEILRAGSEIQIDAVERFLAQLQAVPAMGRLTLAELAAPALRRMTRQAFRAFETALKRLMSADNRISPFEYALHRLLLRHVAPAFRRVDAAPIRFRALKAILPAAGEVLHALAAWGSDSEQAARAAYAAGMARLTPQAPPYPGASLPALNRVDQALNRLAQAAPALKKQLIEACAACIAADGRIGPDQGELLRAVADALDCPMPPLRLGSV